MRTMGGSISLVEKPRDMYLPGAENNNSARVGEVKNSFHDPVKRTIDRIGHDQMRFRTKIPGSTMLCIRAILSGPASFACARNTRRACVAVCRRRTNANVRGMRQ